MTQSFLPENYEVPKTIGGGYMKFQQGDNKFRVMSAVTMGWEYWTEDKKPKRFKEMLKTVPLDADLTRGWPQKHFWAFIVWNFQTKQIEILQITQATIQTALTSLIHNDDWGDPRHYSITVNKTGEKMETKYQVLPSPAKPVPEEIVNAYAEKYINMEALFTGGNPFDAADENKTKVVEIDPNDIPFEDGF